MFDKNWFYYTKNISKDIYNIDTWWSINLVVENNEYIIFHKRHFKKISANNLQDSMQILTKSQTIDFQLDENFFKYALTYYQKSWNKAYIKWANLEKKEIYKSLFASFWLKLRFIEYLEILWDYKNIEIIKEFFKNANIHESLSFLLGLASIYGEWNLIEQDDDVFLWNILIRFPFDWKIAEYQDIILKIEDLLIQNNFYNSLYFTKKQDFIINIKDTNLLNIFWESISKWKLADFFQTQESIKPFFDKNIEKLSRQLEQDLRIKLDKFKLTEIKGIKLNF